MATTKKAHKKTTSKAAGTKRLTSLSNPIPFCVQIDHSQATRAPFHLSFTGSRFPNSLYFMYPTAESGTVTLPRGYFLFHGNPGDAGTFTVKIDAATGMTGILILNPAASAVARPNITWSHQPDRAQPYPPGSGGIIIEG